MWDDFPGWDKEYAKIQQEIKDKEQMDKQQLLSTTLRAKYGVDFASLESYTKLTGLCTDDGCEHYIDMKNQQVYSWNFMDNEWTTDATPSTILTGTLSPIRTLFSK
jgi:hypothetical protein